MKTLLFLFTAAAACLAQTAVFPGGIANSSNLTVARDGVLTTLLSAQASTDTVAVVTSSAGWVPYMIATIDSEQELVTVVAGNVLTVTRAFSGTTAAVHAIGVNVAANVDAYSKMALNVEVTAIETALGANLGNVALAGWCLSPASYGGSLPATIAALPANGGSICLPCNTSYVVPSLSITTSLLLRGCGVSTSIKLANGGSGSTTAMIGAVTAGTSVIFEDVLFDGNRNNNPTSLSDGIFATGLIAFQSIRCVYQNFNANTVLGLTDIGLPVRLDGNSFVNNNTHNIIIASSSFAATFPIVVNNNFAPAIQAITSCTNATPIVCTVPIPAQLLTGQGITIEGSGVTAINGQHVITPIGSGPLYTSFSINSSTAAGASTGGIYLEGGWAVSLEKQGYGTVANNTIRGGATESIAINGSQFCAVHGNTTWLSGDSGITLTGGSAFNVLSSNVISSPWLEGIFLDGFGGASLNLLADNEIDAVSNAISGRGSGIRIGASSLGNIVRGGKTTGNPEHGVLVVSGATNTRIEEVNMEGNTGTPFSHDGSDSGTIVIDHTGVFTFAIINSSPTAFGDGSQIFVADANSTCAAGSSTGRTCFHENGGWLH